MTGKYQAYPEYKDSGVEWLGDVPKDWSVKKLKYICDVQTGSKDTVNAIDDGCYPFFVRSQTVERINSVGADCEAVLTAGDGVGVGKVFHYYNGEFDFHQRVYMLNNFSQVLGRFVYYYLSSNFYKVALEGNAKSTVDSLRLPQFLNFSFSLPNSKIQRKIVQFLDHETAKIDTLIEKQQQLIKLLKEKRQAVISHAVTKGLNPDAPMRDSGVEWLGEVPEHWEVWKLKHTCSEIFLGLTSKVDYVENDGVPLVRALNISGGVLNLDSAREISIKQHKQLTKYRCATRDDVLLSKSGTIGTAAIVDIDDEFSIYESIFALRAKKDRLTPEYLLFFIQSSVAKAQYARDSVGMGVHHLNMPDIQEVRMPIPPVIEQNRILEKLRQDLTKFDNLVTKAQFSINLIQERRTALISAAVTGKIDVRNWQPPEQNPIEREEVA